MFRFRNGVFCFRNKMHAPAWSGAIPRPSPKPLGSGELLYGRMSFPRYERKIAWGSSGKDARFLAKFRRLVGRMDEGDRKLLLHMAPCLLAIGRAGR